MNLSVGKIQTIISNYARNCGQRSILFTKPPAPLKKDFLLLKKIIQNALVMEKELGRAQDIEGGIKDGQIYFWQTRNILSKKNNK